MKNKLWNRYFRKHIKIWHIGIVAIATLCLNPVHTEAARIFVPNLELFFAIKLHDGTNFAFDIQNRTTLALQLDTFNKIGVDLRLGFDQIFDYDNTRQPLNLQLELISVSIGQPLEDPFYLTVFIGDYDDIGSGDDFSLIFNSNPVFSVYRGNRYTYRSGENEIVRYRGLHRIGGTGIGFGTEFGTEFVSLQGYFYRDSRLNILATNTGGGNIGAIQNAAGYSTDLRLLLNFDNIKLDIYGGGTFGSDPPQGGDAGYNGIMGNNFIALRGGIMMALDFPPIFQLYVQVGMPWILVTSIDYLVNNFRIEHFQIMIEPRFNIADLVGLHITALVRPLIYNQRSIPQTSAGIDLNAKLLIGEYASDSFRGGIEALVQLGDQASSFTFQTFKISPFLGLTIAGITFDIAVETQLVPFMPLETLRLFVNARTAF